MRVRVYELKGLVVEALGALRLLNVLNVRLVLSKKMKIEEILTDIRIIKGVSTVNQTSPVNRTPGGKRILDILITFDPQKMDMLEYVDAMSRLIKKISDVKMVIVRTLDGRPVRDASGKKRLVY